ncbi:hypothetical protein B7463_g9423, partial [Scytalidium lignicola]
MSTISPLDNTSISKSFTAQHPLYPKGVNSKFSPDGVVQRFPGNTTLCHIPADSPIQAGLQAFYANLKCHPVLSKGIHILPPASWHMTVLDGIREIERDPRLWPVEMMSYSLTKCTDEFARRLRQLGPELEQEDLGPPYRIHVRQLRGLTVGIGLDVEGATVEEELRLRRLRDKIADAIGFRAPNHETYGLHITFAYLLRYLDVEEIKEVHKIYAQHLPALQTECELGAVEFCTFETMHEFHRLFYLGEMEPTL